MPVTFASVRSIGDVKRFSEWMPGEIQLTDGLRKLAAKKSQGLYAYVYDGKTHDAGDKLGFLKATVEIALRNPQFGAEFRNYLKELKL